MMLIQIEQIFPSLTWKIRHEVMYPELPMDSVKLADDFEGIHFGVYLEHKLTGVVSLFNEGDVYQFRKLAILSDAQKSGLGTQLMNHILDFCKIQKASKLWCNARVNAKEFYYKFGFHETEKTFFKDGYDFVVMEKEL
ncbi:acetyltransferase (GNAT) family protein [Pedobacter psychrotolerans]|uniref:Acetyltransferase (GNAT) family protein n=1 Tax=Pedobacter psychrotolerans TaxID=1843235 RepID=A0A4R2HI75_9SPHI|nr:GNAT family N-acetyltransferase [Pedobacter psychrotolerans]TCO28961.1 acetyltransferase (GNAT) family protein [Pedobacter psychrotolerans]GGE53116.1 N-acetyltransferase [Pedobacter psychrotolerans]